MSDATAQVKQLRATLSKMEIALGKVEESIVWTDIKGRIKWCNAAFDRFLGQPHLLILGAALIQKLPLKVQGEWVTSEQHPVTIALQAKTSGKGCYEFQTPTQILILEIAWSFIEINTEIATAEDSASAVLVVRDVTQQRLAEKSLQESKAALEQLVAHRTQELSQANARLEQEAAQLQTLLQELQATQAQLIQSEKMSSLGQLVAGIAHEINNPVNFIHGNLTYLEETTKDLLSYLALYQQHIPQAPVEVMQVGEEIDIEFLRQDLPKVLSSMQMGTNRIRQIVLSLRNFSRMDEADYKDVDIHEGLESTLLILQHRLKPQPHRAEIEVIREYSDLPLVECYPGQLNQVFMNILANAIDAIEETSTSDQTHSITIRTTVVDGQSVQVAIADTGPGMPNEIQKQIFNPFFTTKPVGRGTGMGMAISYQIITEKHRGQLECCSQPGLGSKFLVTIPICQGLPS